MKTNQSFLFGILMLFSFSSLFLTSCDKETESEFDLPFTLPSVTVPAMGAPFDVNKVFVSEVLTTGIEAKLNEYGASLNDIESAKLKDLRVEITAPNGRTFDAVVFLESFVKADGLTDAKIAYSEGSLDGKTNVTFSSQFENFAEHIKKDAFSLIIQGFIDEAVPTATTLKVDFIVTVKVKTKK